MKILMANKFFYIKGGSETYYFSLKKLLEAHGHEVIDFSMKDERNFPSEYSEYFVDAIDYEGKNPADNLKNACKIIYSFEAKKKLERLIARTKPDIAHLHLFQHQLSTSILDVLKKQGIPIVYTAHEFKMICPNYKMLTGGHICEECKGGRYFSCVKNRCVKGSAAKSLICYAEARLNGIRHQYDKIDRIITPSDFYREKFIEFGVRPERITHIRNFLEDQDCAAPAEGAPYYLYMGRLSEEKGVKTLIQAFLGLDKELKIAGAGPLADSLKGLCAAQDERDGGIGPDSGKDRNGTKGRIKFLGFQSGDSLKRLLEGAKAVILPSEWYENGPYSAIEALRCGKPLIVSDLGGNPELVEENGIVFGHGDPGALAAAVRDLDSRGAQKYERLCGESRRIYEEKYTAGTHYEKIMEIYRSLVSAPGI